MFKSFTSTHTTKLFSDLKIKFPDQFAEIINAEPDKTAFLLPSLDLPMVMGGGLDFIDEIEDKLKDLYHEMGNPLNNDELDLAYYSRIKQIKISDDNHIILHEEIVNHAKLDGAAAFIGAGNKFQIWNPFNFEKYFNMILSDLNNQKK